MQALTKLDITFQKEDGGWAHMLDLVAVQGIQYCQPQAFIKQG